MKKYYKQEKYGAGMLLDQCKFKVNEFCMIGSVMCSGCEYLLYRDVFEKYIICSKYIEEERKEKLKNILDENY